MEEEKSCYRGKDANLHLDPSYVDQKPAAAKVSVTDTVTIDGNPLQLKEDRQKTTTMT